MNRTSAFVAAAALSLAGLASETARAAGTSQSAWVSGRIGVDTASCGAVTAPCRTFQYMHDNIVSAGGQIRVLDPAGYGTLVIRNAISIVNDGVGLAGISAPSGDAIDIQAGPNDAVFLKGLSLDGARTGGSGINLTSAGSLTVANCTITGAGFTSPIGSGLLIDPTASGTVQVFVVDSIFSGNFYAGITLLPNYSLAGGSASIGAVIKNVALNNNGSNGFYEDASHTTGTISATIEDSAVMNNLDGAFVFGAGAPNATLIVNRSNFSDNGTGLASSNNGAILYLSNSVVTNNSNNGVVVGGTVFTYQNNAIRGNKKNVFGTMTPISPGD